MFILSSDRKVKGFERFFLHKALFSGKKQQKIAILTYTNKLKIFFWMTCCLLGLFCSGYAKLYDFTLKQISSEDQKKTRSSFYL